MNLLFVCSGNICRSPMAAQYARHRLARSGLHHVAVDSAGTLGIEGEKASKEAIETLLEAGIELAGHRSRGLREVDLRTADLVVVMEMAHLDFIEREFPWAKVPKRLLLAFESSPEPRGGAPDLDDPIGDPIDAYRACFARIRASVDHLVLHLKHLP